MAFAIGQNVGPYRIVEQLGQGGMATVYKAYHANLDRHVAMKVMHMAFSEDETFLERFKREAQIVAKLDHPHIVPIYDYADFEGQPYLIMKFLQGETLKQRMRREPPTLEDVTTIISAVAEALDYAHKADVLHRDVKPSNIILDNTNTPYLTDFGLARIASTGESTLSQDMMLGTPQYISPEQAQGNVTLTPGTDIYSLGVVLYELVVGRVPFSADTPYAIIHDHIYKPLPLPTTVNPAVPEAVEIVLLKSLAKTPQDRYQTAIDLAEAFNQAIQQSHMTEISIHTLRPDAFNTPTGAPSGPSAPATPAPAPSVASATGTGTPPGMRTEASQVYAPPQATTPPGIPVTTTPPPGTVYIPAQTAASKKPVNGWTIAGCLIFIFSCMLSIIIIADTANDPRLKKDASVGAQDEFPDGRPDQGHDQGPPRSVEEEIMAAAREGRLADEIDRFVQDYEDNPSVGFAQALLALENDDRATAAQIMQETIDRYNPPANLLLQWADILDDRFYEESAVLMHLAAYSAADDASVRQQAGEYLYQQTQNVTTRDDLTTFCALANQYPQSAITQALLAQAVLGLRSLPEPRVPATCLSQRQIVPVKELIEESLQLDDSIAEIHLIYGNYLEKVDRIDEAVTAWETALDFEDVPNWVQREATNKIQSHER